MLNIDALYVNQDWVKQTWDLPPYKSDSFLLLFPDLQMFRELPIYKWAVQKGIIKNDMWIGKARE